MMRPFLLLLAMLMAACGTSGPRTPEPDHAFARAAFVHMGFAVQAAAIRCTSAGRSFDEARAENLFETCTRRLIPARDALTFSVNDLDPWGDASPAKLGCAGKAVRIALQDLRADFAIRQIKTPPVMLDGERLGAWAEQWADRDCDPLHPTTTVTVTVDRVVPENP